MAEYLKRLVSGPDPIKLVFQHNLSYARIGAFRLAVNGHMT